MHSFRVTLLGTGIPDPKPDRYGSSTLVEAGDEKFIFDCGRGSLQRLSETGVPLKEIKRLFLTHLHSDHTVGIPDLWLTSWIFGRWEEPFYVRGPSGTKNMMDSLQKAFEFDLEVRPVHDLLPEKGSRMDVREISEGVVYENNGIKITAFKVDHHPVKHAYGYRIDYKGKSATLSGDTRICENLVKFANNTDLLVHNVGAAREEDLKVSERYRRIMNLHSSPEETGELFAKVRPKLAVYSHMVLFKVNKDYIIERTRKTYDGPLEIGEDLMSFEIGDTIKQVNSLKTPSQKQHQEIVPVL